MEQPDTRATAQGMGRRDAGKGGSVRHGERWYEKGRGIRDTSIGHGTGQQGDANGKGEYEDTNMRMGHTVTNGTRHEGDEVSNGCRQTRRCAPDTAGKGVIVTANRTSAMNVEVVERRGG